MVKFDTVAPPIYFLRFYRNVAGDTTKRLPVFDLAEAKDGLRDALRDRFENHSGDGKPPLMADIIDEAGDQLFVARYVAPNRIDAFELNATKTSVRRVKD